MTYRIWIDQDVDSLPPLTAAQLKQTQDGSPRMLHYVQNKIE